MRRLWLSLLLVPVMVAAVASAAWAAPAAPAARTVPAAPARALQPGMKGSAVKTLQERLKGKVQIDFETARRLFTLITVLHWKG